MQLNADELLVRVPERGLIDGEMAGLGGSPTNKPPLVAGQSAWINRS